MDQPANQRPGRIDPGNQLGNHLQPIVNFDGANALVQRLVHVGLVAVVEKQGQQTQRVLQGVAFAQGYTADKAFEGGHRVLGNHLRRQNACAFDRGRFVIGTITGLVLLLLVSVKEASFKVHDCPRMPCLVPVGLK